MLMTFFPGLSALLTDAREFLAALRFARPDLLWLLLLLPALALVNRYGALRRRKASADVGRPAAVAGLQTHPVRGRRWLGLAYPLGWMALILGLAGPRWGKSDEPGVAAGRDLVVVVDLSRSMLADDMAARDAPRRWEAARMALRDLMDAVARRGGHRVGLVVFAARAKLVCPLTTDYDHIRAKIEEIDGEYPPIECRPGPDAPVASGTRIGAGLIAAVQAHDARFPGYQDIILVSDGDDPADDREWAKGADTARRASIPVHAVGVGDPDRPSLIVIDGQILESAPNPDAPPNPVQTRLHEDVLRQVAAETRGEYLAARRDAPRLGEFFRSRIEPLSSREVSDDAVPQPKERYAWFLAPALALLAIGWLRGR
jgi:Ca-activated chloride channel family protein